MGSPLVAKASLLAAEDGFNLPPLNKEEGSEFGWFDRLLFGWRDGMVFDYGDWEARDLYEMFAKDYKAAQLEKVLSLPVLAAERSITPAKGDKGEAEWLTAYWETDHMSGGCKTPLDHIVDQMTTAIAYKRAYYEKVWTTGTGDFKGKTVYDKVAWRPQTTCRLMRDPHHGAFMGFEQEAYYVGPEITKGHWPIQIPRKRAFVYIHGLRRDPLNGVSDLEIPYWAWKTKQKILFLWFQFLEAVSLPRTVVTANDIGTAQQVARQIAKLKSSGIIPVAAPQGPSSVGITALDVSGKGAEQFQAAINWLDNAATDSVLAGFLNLTNRGTAISPTGSFALSKDASDFFLQAEEQKTREMAYSIRRDLFAPLIRYNFGPSAAIPMYNFEPLNDVDKSNSVTLLQALLASPTSTTPVPPEFVADLASQVGNYIGLDAGTVKDQFAAASAAAQKAAAEQSAAGASDTGQGVAGMAGAVDQAATMVRTAKGQQQQET